MTADGKRPRLLGRTPLRLPTHGRGQPPRVRRSRGPRTCFPTASGLTSARAEEPPTRWLTPSSARVDLRACGATTITGYPEMLDRGQPPRVRRSRRDHSGHVQRPGSTSARAEEPAAPPTMAPTCQVDLRACGGAATDAFAILISRGRPPRVRRSRHVPAPQHGGRGSTSARAEEPCSPCAPHRSSWVDLRACGGATLPLPVLYAELGQPPRVRRSRGKGHPYAEPTGSTSARAEEPKCC